MYLTLTKTRSLAILSLLMILGQVQVEGTLGRGKKLRGGLFRNRRQRDQNVNVNVNAHAHANANAATVTDTHAHDYVSKHAGARGSSLRDLETEELLCELGKRCMQPEAASHAHYPATAHHHAGHNARAMASAQSHAGPHGYSSPEAQAEARVGVEHLPKPVRVEHRRHVLHAPDYEHPDYYEPGTYKHSLGHRGHAPQYYRDPNHHLY